MQVNIKAIVKGAGFFTGQIDGRDFNTGSIFVEEPFDASKPNYKGFRTVEYKCTDGDIVKPIMHLPFPINADVVMELSATKNGSVIIVTKIIPSSVEKK